MAKEDQERIVNGMAKAMRERLRANNHKGDEWSDVYNVDGLMLRLYEEVAELGLALNNGSAKKKVAREAADVANFAAMIADNAGAYE